jgi:phospholipid/cholesterol/gamma-HCH transport system permease protein
MFQRVVGFITSAGEVGQFGARAVHDIFRPPLEMSEVGAQVFELGSKSVPLIIAAGLALGAVVAMQAAFSMSRFGAKSLVPQAVSIGMFRVLGPLVTGLLISGRVGAGIGAQLGGMRVTQQIDALEALAVDSFKYLVVTRILACVVALPILTVLMDFSGLAGGMFLDMATSHVSMRLFIQDAFNALGFGDYIPTILKTFVFGFIIGTMSCFLGYNSSGGAAGVGRAATRSVVFCSILLIAVDIILVKLSLFWNIL